MQEKQFKSIIEIGSFSIKTIIFSNENDAPKIVGVGKSNTQGFDGNVVSSFDDLIDSIKKSVVQAEKQSNFIIKDCFILLANKSIKINKFKNSLILDDSIIEKNDIRKLSKIKLKPQKDFLQNINTSHYQINDDLITDNPIGLSCKKVSRISLISMIDKKQVDLIENIFQKLQIKIINFMDSTTSYFLYLKGKQLSKKNLILIDFGFNHINILIIKNKQISFIRTLPIGCRLISDDLVKMLNISFDFAEKLKISTIDLFDDRNPTIEIPVWEEFGNNIKNKIEHNYIKKIITSRLDEIFNTIFKILPQDNNFYSYLFTGGGSQIKNFQLYFRSKYGHEIQFLEPPGSSGIPKVLNDSSFMSIYCAFYLQTQINPYKDDFLKKIDSFSNKIWYKRFVDLL